MTTLPTWMVYVVSIGSPLLSFGAVTFGQWITRRGDRELEIRSRREETMRTLRWAAELSARTDERVAKLGVAELAALLDSDLLEAAEKVFVEAALDAVYEDVEEEIDVLGGSVDIVEKVLDHGLSQATGDGPDVSLGTADRP